MDNPLLQLGSMHVPCGVCDGRAEQERLRSVSVEHSSATCARRVRHVKPEMSTCTACVAGWVGRNDGVRVR